MEEMDDSDLDSRLSSRFFLTKHKSTWKTRLNVNELMMNAHLVIALDSQTSLPQRCLNDSYEIYSKD